MKNQTESIERYLRQEMSPEELKQFTFQMVMDKKLREEVEQMRMVFKTIRSQDGSPKSGAGKWIYAVAFLAVLLVGSLYLLNSEETVIPEKEEMETTIVQRPIAKANEPNEFMENLITGVRKDFDFTVINEPLKNTLSLNAQNDVSINLNVNLNGKHFPKTLILEVYDNQEGAYKNEEFLLKENVSVSENGKISFEKDLRLPLGLYYYLLILPQTGDLVKGGKFYVK